MTRQQMIEKLQNLKAGMMIVKDGKTYEIKSINQQADKKMCRTDISLLEVGKPETYQKAGVLLAAGKVFTMSNIIFNTWYAQAQYMNFEIA